MISSSYYSSFNVVNSISINLLYKKRQRTMKRWLSRRIRQIHSRYGVSEPLCQIFLVFCLRDLSLPNLFSCPWERVEDSWGSQQNLQCHSFLCDDLTFTYLILDVCDQQLQSKLPPSVSHPEKWTTFNLKRWHLSPDSTLPPPCDVYLAQRYSLRPSLPKPTWTKYRDTDQALLL